MLSYEAAFNECHQVYQIEQFVEVEMHLLSAVLNWKTFLVTPQDFFPPSGINSAAASNLIDICLLDYSISSHSPAVLAKAALIFEQSSESECKFMNSELETHIQLIKCSQEDVA